MLCTYALEKMITLSQKQVKLLEKRLTQEIYMINEMMGLCETGILNVYEFIDFLRSQNPVLNFLNFLIIRPQLF